MPPKTPPKPTDAELELLSLLWEHGPATVREVHTRLSTDRHVGYTTVLKLLQIMTDKGLVERDESARSHVYRARHEPARVQRHLVRDLLDRAFAGSTARLVQSALSTKRASAEELAEIRTLLRELEKDQGAS